MTSDTAANPFLSESTLPYGRPDFANISDEHYRPAFEAGFAAHLAEIAAIGANAEPATFENTVLALERSGRLLYRVSVVFYNNTSSHATESMQALET